MPRVLRQATVCPLLTVTGEEPNAPDPMSATMSIVTLAPPPGATGFDFFLQERAVRPSTRIKMASSAPWIGFMKRTLQKGWTPAHINIHQRAYGGDPGCPGHPSRPGA